MEKNQLYSFRISPLATSGFTSQRWDGKMKNPSKSYPFLSTIPNHLLNLFRELIWVWGWNSDFFFFFGVFGFWMRKLFYGFWFGNWGMELKEERCFFFGELIWVFVFVFSRFWELSSLEEEGEGESEQSDRERREVWEKNINNLKATKNIYIYIYK